MPTETSSAAGCGSSRTTTWCRSAAARPRWRSCCTSCSAWCGPSTMCSTIASAGVPRLVSLFSAAAVRCGDMLEFAFSAGPLPALGNLILNLIYGFTLGQLYDASADEPNLSQDLVYDEPLERPALAHSEDFGAAGIIVGGVSGIAVGVGLAVVLPGMLPSIDTRGWSIALTVGGILAGGAVCGSVGSFAGLPNGETDPAEIAQGEDPFDHTVLPFLLPPVVVLVIVAIIVSFGTGLLRLGKDHVEIGPIVIAQAVVAAVVGVVVIGLGALWLATRPDHSRPSRRETVSHTDH